ncbi:LytTR family DNA-binding domain-containing protein [Alteromonas ponticola]|uniref:LytTR family DNA-binding domain-containing protein n=1 Tax=Alteromonas aquimaris TaxID=2998417 RepID=A0ABT3P8K7_9ALTE|nr:LytTR family DNA-binding domain-containing protein [Alteromonas aquimaris]MCW8109106.1 LytTR family DNA-binding domain-containing protein [Alteromonas aquimaris]
MYKVLVADDERIARQLIVNLLAQESDIATIVEARDGNEALELAHGQQPDIVFLDIQMPGQTGIELAAKLPTHCAIIFVSAYEGFAIDAFELCAADYILKPFDDARFYKALDKARTHLQTRLHIDRDSMAEFFSHVMSEQHNKYKSRLVVKETGRIRFINVESINYIEGAGNYVDVHLNDGSQLLHRETLTRLESQLDPTVFARIHRSTIVRQSNIKELKPANRGDYEVTMKSGDRLILSRRHKFRLSDFMD